MTKTDGFAPFRYAQNVFFYGDDEQCIDAKVQGTVVSKPEYLFVVDFDGKGHEVAKARLFAKEEINDHDSEADVPLSVSPTPTGFSGVDAVTKETNPKDALAGLKPRWFSFIPLRVLVGVGKAMFEGAWKYGKHNYRESGVRASVYVDAAVCGHLMPWMEGQDYDENGMHHIDKAIASLMVLRDSMLNGNWIDDRPQAARGLQEQIDAETAHFAKMKQDLHAKFGDPVEPYTEINRGKVRSK